MNCNLPPFRIFREIALYQYIITFFHVAADPSGPGPLHFRGFTIAFRHATLSRTPLDEWSVRRRGLYLSTYDTHNRQTLMPTVGFEPAIPTSERPQTPRRRRHGYHDRQRIVLGVVASRAFVWTDT